MKLLIALCALAVTATVAIDITADPVYSKFAAFMKKYNRRYATQSEVRGRFQIFKENLQRIAQRNARGGSDKHGINKFTDIHPEEFRQQFKGYKPNREMKVKETLSYGIDLNNVSISAIKSIDWRTRGAVTAVKNQGQCGSCWAFSATEQVESDIFLKTGTLYTLAPQQIVSCDTVDLGCNGGNTNTAYQYIMQAGGLEYNKDYRYTSGNTMENGVCKFKKADIATDITGFDYVSQAARTEPNMYAQIQKSPISICVDATIWQTYMSGVITTQSGCGTQLDHCVQVVGANANAKKPYWIVRNSWATDWGVDGYIFVEAGHDVCGIATDATIVTPN